ncbi:MAG: sigma-70 family RNA polymerase sigma factor [Nocardioidaceae bacterium]
MEDTSREAAADEVVVELVPVVRRVVAARIKDPHVVDDLVQETLARVVASRDGVEGDLAPYAVVTARNLIARHAENSSRARRHAHRLVDADLSEQPGDNLLRQEDRSAVRAALGQLTVDERDLLVAHEIHRETTADLAEQRDTTPGAVAAQLARIRAKLRVEYLLSHEQVEPPSDQCRPVLRAISGADRRRARELDARGHLLGCATCSRLSKALATRRPARAPSDEVCIPIGADADVVTARQKGREIAGQLGFSSTECTVVATAISEVARNIVKFAQRGELHLDTLTQNGRDGLQVIARDVGPGIPDLGQAMQDGYSTYRGLGLGLPGCRRLMDDFSIVSTVGEGTTVTMTKWQERQRLAAAASTGGRK